MEAFGGPGVTPTWTSGAKSGVGTSASANSLLWFTISQGILNEIYYPSIDVANIKDAQFLITTDYFFSEEKTDTSHEIERLDPWSPAFRITNTCFKKRYRIIKKVTTDPDRNVVLQHVQFEPLTGSLQDYSLYSLVTPHMANMGFGNDAWTGEYKGSSLLYASREGVFLAVMDSQSFIKRSVGYGTHRGRSLQGRAAALAQCLAL